MGSALMTTQWQPARYSSHPAPRSRHVANGPCESSPDTSLPNYPPTAGYSGQYNSSHTIQRHLTHTSACNVHVVYTGEKRGASGAPLVAYPGARPSSPQLPAGPASRHSPPQRTMLSIHNSHYVRTRGPSQARYASSVTYSNSVHLPHNETGYTE